MTPSRSAKMIASGASSTMRWQSHSRSYVAMPHDLPVRSIQRIRDARRPDRTLLYPHLAFSAASKESDMRRLLAVAPAEVDPLTGSLAAREFHNGYVRAQPRSWDAAGAPSSDTTGSYELICPACGDDGGSYERQPSELQEVRGPYPSVRAARRAMREHQGLAQT